MTVPNFDTHFGLLIEQISLLIQRKVVIHLQEEGYDITFNEFLVLVLLGSNPDGISQKEIAERLFKDKAMITRLTKSLEKLQLLQRQTDSADARSNKVSLTHQGRAALQSLDKVMIPLEESFIQSLPRQEFLVFSKTLQKLLAHGKAAFGEK